MSKKIKNIVILRSVATKNLRPHDRSFAALRMTLLFVVLFFPHIAKSAPLCILPMHGTSNYNCESVELSYAKPDAPKGGAMKTAAIGTFDTLNPYSLKGTAPQGMSLVYDRLMQRIWDEPFTMAPLIAQGYEMPEDRSSITFTLNPAAKFHDGTPITAEDVAFSFETLKNHGRPNMRRVYQLVTNVDIPNPQTISFTFGEGYDRETALILAMMPVLSKTYWQDKDFDATTMDANIPLNGPYRIKSFDQGRYITYERVADYWAKDLFANKGQFNFDDITYEYYRDDGVAFEAFASGRLDLRREMDITKWQKSYNIPAVQSGNIITESLPHQRPEPTSGFIFNTRRGPFDDVTVRQALSLLLDRHSLNKILFNNEKKFITSYFPNSEFEINPEIIEPYNLRQSMRDAGELLKQAGWTIENGAQVKNGKKLSFEVLVQTAEDEKLALHYAQTLKRLGIEMRIRTADAADFIRRLQNYDYDMVLHYWRTTLSPGTEQVIYWGCDAANQPGRFNYPGICTPEIDALSYKVAQTTSRAELVEIMQALDKELLKGYYIVPLFYIGKDYMAYKRELGHPETTPLYGTVLETWWMNNANQQNSIEHQAKP